MVSRLNNKQKWFIGIVIVLVVAFYWSQGRNVSFQDGGAPVYEDFAVSTESVRSFPAASKQFSARSDGFVAESDVQKVLKTASLTLHVDNVQDAVDEVTKLVDSWKGYVESSNVDRYDGQYTASLSLRVPADQLDSAMLALKDMSNFVVNEYQNSEDITETYLDLDARLKNLKSEEAQYQTIMERAETVEDVLKVTDSLSRVRGEIESIESRLKYYDTRVEFAQLSVSLQEDVSVSGASETWRPKGTIRQAFTDWVGSLQGVVDGLIYLLIYGWPILLILLAIWLVKRKR